MSDIGAVEHAAMRAGLAPVLPHILEVCSPSIRLVADPQGTCVLGGVPHLDTWPAVDGVALRFIAGLHVPSLREVGEGVAELAMFPECGWVLLFAFPEDLAPLDGFATTYESVVVAEEVTFDGLPPFGADSLPLVHYRPELSWSVDVPAVERLAGQIHIDEWVGAGAVNRFLRILYGNPPYHQIGGLPWGVGSDPREVAVLSQRETPTIDLTLPGAYDETLDEMEEVWYSDDEAISNPEAGRTQGWSLAVQLSSDDLGQGGFGGLWWGSDAGRAFWVVAPDDGVEQAHLVTQAGEVF